ncbi:Gfo/Idh/MocA family protein [Microlunatus sp. GCM10028923]|uniref:Gfo/Idh/MocA family protein n=1 Tax=Microlunatus sp. GCM10028923 TaxID=3273400 RepID=UPI003618FC46
MSRVRIALIGLGFGAEFIPIYQRHPDAELIAICQRDPARLDAIGNAFGVDRRYTSYEELLADPDVDAVHLNTPIPVHAEQTLAGLAAGKHVACTVPMATSVEDCRRIVVAAAEARRNYMMMETVVFSREFLYVDELHRSGELGRIQFLRGAHQQEMAGWPGYWEGLPPMHYATHAVSPLLALAGGRPESVVCQGSGRIADDLAGRYGSPFAVESALIKIADTELAAEATRSLFETAREYVESFAVYADRASFEWGQTQADQPVLFRGELPERVEVPDYADRLPEEIRSYTTRGVYDDEHAHLSFTQGSGHGGSHPHLAHEFVRSIVEQRAPGVDAVTAARWTSVGLCAHESAIRGGERVVVPSFDPG